MIQCLVQSLKAELISRPSYPRVPAGRHEAISGLWCPPTVPAALSLPHPSLLSGIYFPAPPPRKVTPSEILHLLSLSLRFPLPMMDELHSGVSEPVHQSLRLGIKNCQRFTKATPHFFSSSPNAASHPTKLATPLPKPLYRKIPHHHHQHDIPMQPNILSPVQMHQTPTFI